MARLIIFLQNRPVKCIDKQVEPVKIQKCRLRPPDPDIRRDWDHGEVSEWLIEPVSKTGVPLAGTAGSNPALSVNF